MFERLVAWIVETPEEELQQCSLEDMAIAASWYDSFSEVENGPQLPYAALSKRLDAWGRMAEASSEKLLTLPQPVSRELLEAVSEGQFAELSRDELDFLYFAWTLAQRVRAQTLRNRFGDVLRPFISQLESRRDRMPDAPGLPKLGERLTVVTTADLKMAQMRDVKLFAGIDSPLRGPLLNHKGNLKILGETPPKCGVAVENGSCHLVGLVAGKVAATEHCYVQGNVSGVVIARRGDVTVGQVLNPAVVISKEGSVRCGSVQGPKTLFASRELHIRGDVDGGESFGRFITIEGEALSGIISASERLQARHFRASANESLRIVLRRGLTYQDYGEVLTEDAQRLLMNSMRLRGRLLNLRLLISITEREADEFAGNALYFLLGSSDISEDVRKLERLQRYAIYIERLIAAGRALTLALEDSMTMGDTMSDESFPTPFGAEEDALLAELERELRLLTAEGAVTRELHEEREHLLQAGRRLLQKLITYRTMLTALDSIQEQLWRLQQMHNQARQRVQQAELALERAIGRATILERAKEACARVEVLNQLTSEGRRRPRMDRFRERCNDRYITIMRRNIEGRLSRVGEYRGQVKDVEEQMSRMRTRLWLEHQVSLPMHVLEGGNLDGAYAEGRFEAGVRLAPWAHLFQTDKGGRNTLFSRDSGDEILRYVRTVRGVFEAGAEGGD